MIKEAFKKFFVKLGLMFLKQNIKVSDEMLWFLSDHVEFNLPAGAPIYETMVFYTAIQNKTTNLLEYGNIIIGYTKRRELTNGDLVVSIEYISASMFSNLIKWAEGNLLSFDAPSIDKFIRGDTDEEIIVNNTTTIGKSGSKCAKENCKCPG